LTVLEYSRIVADSISQPCGTSGFANLTSERALWACREITLLVASVPWFADGDVWPFQLSAAAAAISGALVQFGGASTVQL
jgi:hypothetical protein